MESYTDKLQREIKESESYVKEIVNVVLSIQKENETDFDNMWEREHKTLKAVEKILDQYDMKKRISSHIQVAIQNVRNCESDLGFMGSPQYYSDKKLIEDYVKSQTDVSPHIKTIVGTTIGLPKENRENILKGFLYSYVGDNLSLQMQVDRDYIMRMI